MEMNLAPLVVLYGQPVPTASLEHLLDDQLKDYFLIHHANGFEERAIEMLHCAKRPGTPESHLAAGFIRERLMRRGLA